MKRLFVTGLVVLIAITALRADDSQFNDYLKYTQEVIARHHLIVYAKIEFDDSKKKDVEFRYDHYPEVERIQLPGGATYARKKDRKWLKSEDWGETGKPAPAKVTENFEGWIGLANAPLLNIHEERDKSQGGVVPTLLSDEGGDSKEIVFELRREHSTGVLYPRFGFVPFGGKALIHTFNGPMHFGADHVMAHFRYDFMFQVQMTEVTPTPSSSLPPSGVSENNPASPGTEELLKAACQKMERGSWTVDATLILKSTTRIRGLISGRDFDLTTEPQDGSAPAHQATIATLSWSSPDGGKHWNKTDAGNRSLYNRVHSPLLANEPLPSFELVGTESHNGETWQHLRLKVPEKIEDEARLPNYWVALDAKGAAMAVRRFAGPVIIQGEVGQAKIDYGPSKEPFITPPMMKRR